MGGGAPINTSVTDSGSASADQSSSESKHYIGASGLVSANLAGVVGGATSVSQQIGAVHQSNNAASSSSPLGSGSNAGAATYSAAGTGTGGGDLGGSTVAQPNAAAEQVAEWKSHSLSNKNSSGANVTINVNIAKASDDEARRLATMVKKYLDEDKHVDKMGRL
jgi:hypothetical protein